MRERSKKEKIDGEKKQMLQAIILDRDGVLIKDKGFVHKIKDIELYPRVIEALQRVDKKAKVIIITNQAGIAKGIYTEENYRQGRNYIHALFEKHSIKITAEYFCPHHPEGTVAPYNVECNCRKPASGLFERAIKEQQLDSKNCWTIGDMRRDILAGQRVGMKTILVKTGFGGKGGSGDEITPNYIAEDLYDAIKFIQEQEKEEKKKEGKE